MGGGRSRKRATESSQDGTGSATGSLEEMDIVLSTSVGEDVPEDLREFGLWTDDELRALLNVVWRNGRLKPSDLVKETQSGLQNKAPHDVETLVTRLRGALSVQSGWRRGCEGADSRGASLGALASELGHSRRQRAEGTSMLTSLRKAKSDLDALTTQMKMQAKHTRRANAQVPREVDKTRAASRRRADVESTIVTSKRALELAKRERTNLISQLATTRMNELEARRRLDRIMLKIAATRGQMTCETVADHIPTAEELKLDEDPTSTELRLLRNRLDMHETEARDWQHSMRAIEIQTNYAKRATSLLNFEVERVANGNNIINNSASKHPRTRPISSSNNPNPKNNLNNATNIENKRPTKKARKAPPKRNANAVVEVRPESENMTDVNMDANTDSAIANTPTTPSTNANAAADANLATTAMPNSCAPTAAPSSSNTQSVLNVIKDTTSASAGAPQKTTVNTAVQHHALVQSDAS